MLIVDKFISKWCFHKLAITKFEQSLNWMFSNKERGKNELVFWSLKRTDSTLNLRQLKKIA
ncbi:MAG: hypothetical protein COW76_06405 [Shewanella sp. CG18_big_fil_WC_8_21_14_2_50_42_11]|nr:MAG: hypothetical protein COW76_06405 [Shewanella sp. CG18_big_fil_WC_8_21_14_2_50_42_11]PIX72365.1 MAG: hypothetical protein COZ42_05650 [Shewanella sp. CG_4_10_14_3_um_filter_42_91]PIY63700.1 MAG: hypothetical protein COY92_20245 [Shewanella sp. CG_4_10_14_0_8_um_filter_42_13]